MEIKRFLPKIGVAILFSAFYSFLIASSLVMVGLFAMGCGALCSTSNFLNNMFIGIGIAILVLTIVEFFIFKKVMKQGNKKGILWTLSSFLLIVVVVPVISFLMTFTANRYTSKVMDKVAAPFYDAQLIRPKIAYFGKSLENDPKTGTVSAVIVRLQVTVDRPSRLKIQGILYTDISERPSTGNMPKATGETIVNATNRPTEFSIKIEKLPNNTDLMSLGDYRILGVSADYIADPAKYETNAQTMYNPINDVEDAGKNILQLISDLDTRAVFYDISK